MMMTSPGADFQSAFRPKNDQEFTKLEVDLLTVFEKVKLCREMLRESPGIQEDEALAEVVGFLEACRDRMADVIEAGTQGLLNEELLAKCFRANDAIFRTLDAEKVGVTIPYVDKAMAASMRLAYHLLTYSLEFPERNEHFSR
jgi:hypothetical protein